MSYIVHIYLKPLETVLETLHALLTENGNTGCRGRSHCGNNTFPSRELLRGSRQGSNVAIPLGGVEAIRLS